MSTTHFVMSPEDKNYAEPELQSELYSSYAYLHPKRPIWRVQVQGQVYIDRPLPFSKRLLLRGLTRALHLTPEQSASDIFRSRVSGFLMTPKVGQRMRVQHDAFSYRIRQRSRRSGLFQGRIDMPVAGLPLVDVSAPAAQTLSIMTGLECGASSGSVFLAGLSGVSIITDIDDTIKQTDVTRRSRMLARTFVEEFESIAGMAEVYRHWEELGGLFHYVSSSPWQIYRPLTAFIDDHGFPKGSMHLKWFRLRDEVFKRWSIVRRKSKTGVIAQMLKRMPYRKFLMIGDSGERDPEIYAKVAKRFPQQILGIFIRDLDEHPIDGTRHDRLIKRLGAIPLTLFREPHEIADSLERAQKLG
ncbi:MAG: phosphatase domain-containing protein [Pirellulaceae bacterium]|nr:phosphatase domain-containing protein [Pirellulaceae bacterium]